MAIVAVMDDGKHADELAALDDVTWCQVVSSHLIASGAFQAVMDRAVSRVTPAEDIPAAFGGTAAGPCT